MKRIIRLSIAVIFLMASSAFSYSQNSDNTASDYLPDESSSDPVMFMLSVDSSTPYYPDETNIYRVMEGLTHPFSLPYEELSMLRKASMPNMWNATVKTPEEYEQRGSGGNVFGFYQYDRAFDHDVPDMAIQYILEEYWDLARQIMEGATFGRLSEGLLMKERYNDAIPKYLITLAQYLQTSRDEAYFSEELFRKIRNCAHAVHNMHKEQLKPDLQNPEAYGLIQKGKTLDNGNEYLVVDNFAALHGFTAYQYICDRLGETDESQWAKTEMEDLNNCLNKAIDISLKEQGSEWYNACFSFDYDSVLVSGPGNWFGTTLMMPSFPWNASLKGFELGGTWKDQFDQSIEWLIDNQSSPKQWGESFHNPDPVSGRAIAWENVDINDGKKIDFSLKQDGNEIIVKISGDNADGNIVVDLPVLEGKKIIKPGNTKEIIIKIQG